MANKDKKRQKTHLKSRKLLDSNIIIYAAKPRFEFLRTLIAEQAHYVSDISKLEVLGYHKLKKNEYKALNEFFDAAPILKISDKIIERAISLRQEHKLSVADSIIAATALENKLMLITRNTKDFKMINGLKLYNPFEEQKA